MFEAHKDYPQKDRFIPCICKNPNLYDTVEELGRAAKRYWFRCLKLMLIIQRYLDYSSVRISKLDEQAGRGVPRRPYNNGLQWLPVFQK
jgi:hypothetical protein